MSAAGGTAAPSSLQRATVWMAAGTTVSRLTGVLRVVALAVALGATPLADSYNLANSTPNMLYDIVLGGVLSATFIPVFVERLATKSEREAWRAISAVVTLSVVVLVVMTLVFWIAAPQVIDAFTFLAKAHGSVSARDVAAEKSVATSLLRWFVPQVALYGAIALITALLNTRRRFVAPMWVPIANNVVCAAVLLWFHQVVTHPSVTEVQSHPWQITLLGLGTTAGVAVQAVLLLMTVRGAGLGRVRWTWAPGHEAVRTIVRLGSWTFGFVLANQIALYVVLVLAVGSSGPDPVSAYTYAYTFMQMPYAVVAVSVMSAVQPDLAQQWSTDNVPAFRQRMTGGLRAVLAIIIPAAVGMFLLAKPAVALLIGHGAFTASNSGETGATLAMFSLGLPGFCTFLYVVRVLQAMQRTRVAFWLYLLENGVNIVLAIALVHPLGVRGLALSLSVAYSVAAVAGVLVLRNWLGHLGDDRTWVPLRRVALASLVMGIVVLIASNLSGSLSEPALLLRVLGSVVVGGAVYAATAALVARYERRRGPPPRRAAPSDERGPALPSLSLGRHAAAPEPDESPSEPGLRQPQLRLVARSTSTPASPAGTSGPAGSSPVVPGFRRRVSRPQPRHVRIRPPGSSPRPPERPE